MKKKEKTMRKLSFIAVSALLVLGIASCKKNSDVQNSESKKAMVKTEFIELPTTGEAERTGGTKVKWVQLWAGGPKWAEYNVGATSVGEYGGYYAWGGGQDKVDDHYTEFEDIQGESHDTAKNLWGDRWQMPTKADYDNLLANCDETLYFGDNKYEGMNGVLYTGKGDYSDNSVFFPAAGFCHYGKVGYTGSLGYYGCSTPSNRDYTYDMSFNSSSQEVVYFNRSQGSSVRAVLQW